MDWCGVDYCDVFIRLSFWRHPFTAEHPLLRHWCSDTFLQIWWRNKLILILNGLRMSTFSVIFGWTVALMALCIWAQSNKMPSGCCLSLSLVCPNTADAVVCPGRFGAVLWSALLHPRGFRLIKKHLYSWVTRWPHIPSQTAKHSSAKTHDRINISWDFSMCSERDVERSTVFVIRIKITLAWPDRNPNKRDLTTTKTNTRLVDMVYTDQTTQSLKYIKLPLPALTWVTCFSNKTTPASRVLHTGLQYYTLF